MQIAGAAGGFEVQVGQAFWIFQQLELQTRVAHMAAHRAVAARIHHQALQGAIGGDAQVYAAMGHLHRAGQQQPSRHGAAQ